MFSLFYGLGLPQKPNFLPHPNPPNNPCVCTAHSAHRSHPFGSLPLRIVEEPLNGAVTHAQLPRDRANGASLSTQSPHRPSIEDPHRPSHLFAAAFGHPHGYAHASPDPLALALGSERLQRR